MVVINKEEFDIFDRKGKLIGKKTRNEVHREGFIHKSVLIFVLNSKKKVFLQKRSENKDLNPGRWDMSVGEHLHAGEDYLDGARRGLFEELGIKDIEPEKITEPILFEVKHNGMMDREYCMIYKAIFDAKIDVEEDEISEGRFYSKTEIEKIVDKTPDEFTPFFLMSWKMVKDKIFLNT